MSGVSVRRKRKTIVGEATPVVSTRFEFGVSCDAPATAPGAPRDRARASASRPPSRRACVSSSRGQTHLADVAHGPGVGAERDALVLGNHGVGGVDAAGAGRIKGGRGKGARVSSRSRRAGTGARETKRGSARRYESSARLVARRVAAFGPRGARETGRKRCRFPPVRRVSRVARAPLIARPAHHRVVGAAHQGGRVRRAHLAESLHRAWTRGRLDERAFGVNAGARRSALLRGSQWMARESVPAGGDCGNRNSWPESV